MLTIGTLDHKYIACLCLGSTFWLDCWFRDFHKFPPWFLAFLTWFSIVPIDNVSLSSLKRGCRYIMMVIDRSSTEAPETFTHTSTDTLISQDWDCLNNFFTRPCEKKNKICISVTKRTSGCAGIRCDLAATHGNAWLHRTRFVAIEFTRSESNSRIWELTKDRVFV